MIRKLLSLMLCLCLTLTLVPDWSFALAEGEKNSTSVTTDEVKPAKEQNNKKSAKNLEEDASFTKGYVKVLGRTKLYTSSKGDSYTLTLSKGSIGFALSRPNAGKAYDRLKVAVNINGKEVAGYVVAKSLVAMTDKEIKQLRKDLKGKDVVYANDNKDRPLPEASHTAATAPAAAVATEQIDKNYTAAVADNGAPELSNPDKGANTKLPAVGKALTKEEMDKAKVIELGGDMPQSSHPYSNYMNTLYTYRVTLSSSKAPLMSVALCFNRNTYFENGYDYLYVYDGEGHYVGRYTGSSLAQKYLIIDTDQYYYLRLVTDRSYTYYGFKVDKAYAFCEPQITSIATTSSGKPEIRFTRNTDATKYILQRATVNKKTGSVDSYKTVSSGKPTKKKYVDKTAKDNVLYSYRLQLQYKFMNKTYVTNVYSYKPYFNGTKKPTISKFISVSNGTGVKLKWSGTGAQKYDVLRSTSKNGTYSCIGTTSSTSYVDKPSWNGKYFYKIRPNVTFNDTKYNFPMSAAKSYTFNGAPSTPTNPTNPITYRALVIGQKYAGTSSELYGTVNDARGMQYMMQNMTSTPYTVTFKSDLTASGIKSAIATVFGQADSNDVTLLYYSGHGVYYTSSEWLGALCGTGNTYIRPSELRTVLDQYQGKKVVMIDACHSGNMIGKEVGTLSESAFTNAFMAPFKNAKANLAASGYYVLTAAHSSTSSYETSFGGVRMGVFTYAVTYGCGWDMRYSSRLSSLYADANSNNQITLNELYNYTRTRVSNLGYGSRQQCQVYPTNSSQVLFGR